MTSAVVNHLWQSTVFAVLAGLLTVAFRHNRAQVRYWMWFSASVKFLAPFSLLLTLGSYFARSHRGEPFAAPAINYKVVEVVEPFPETPSPALSPQTHGDWIPIALVSLWACGLAGVVLIRLRGWQRIRAAVRASTPMEIKFPVPVRSTIPPFGAGRRWDFQALAATPRRYPGASLSKSFGINSRPRTVPRAPPRQPDGSDSHDRGSSLLVSSLCLVDQRAIGGRTRTRLRRSSPGIGQRTANLCRKYLEDLRILCGIAYCLCVRGLKAPT